MIRAYVRWSGGPMGAGLSVLNFQSAALFSTDVVDLANGINTALGEWTQIMPSGVTVQVANEMELRDDATGQLQQVVSGTVPASRVGTQTTQSYAAGVGARVRWNTAGVRNGRPVVGTTFIVPIANNAFETNGTISSVAISRLQGGADQLISLATATECPLAVWSKPTTSGGGDGILSLVTSAGVPDQASWLTSRRS